MNRAEHRLEIARGLLHAFGVVNLPADAEVLPAIRSLPPADQEHLKGLVDWVEEYDNGEGL